MDVKLSTGKEITLNMEKMTTREYLSFFDENITEKDKQAIIARVAGLTMDEWLDLPHPDTQQRIVPAFWKKVREPLTDPNSASAST